MPLRSGDGARAFGAGIPVTQLAGFLTHYMLIAIHTYRYEYSQNMVNIQAWLCCSTLMESPHFSWTSSSFPKKQYVWRREDITQSSRQ